VQDYLLALTSLKITLRNGFPAENFCGEIAMSMHSSHHEPNFLQKPSGQITLLILAAVILGAFGWFYAW
jgi:hypothetical protein